MTIFRKEDILWLQIAIDNIKGMQVLKRQNDLGCVKSNLAFSKSSLLIKMEKKGAARFKF